MNIILEWQANGNFGDPSPQRQNEEAMLDITGSEVSGANDKTK